MTDYAYSRMRYSWPDIARRLREARKSADLTQAHLAVRAEVGSRTVPLYETGDGSKLPASPDLDVIEKVATALGTTAAWILYGLGETPPAQTLDLDLFTAEEQANIATYLGYSPTNDQVLKAVRDVSFHRVDWRKVAKVIELQRSMEEEP